MKKLIKIFIFSVGVLMLVLVFAGLFFIDIGINSKFFIERHFNQAFQYRITGDCDSFVDYVYRDIRKWKERCKEEKTHGKEPIRNFGIQQVSHKFLNDRAFLQVELIRNVEAKEDYTYSVSYEMKKSGLKWKIDQEIK